MIWLIGAKGMLGRQIAECLEENKMSYVGTDIDVDITNIEALDNFIVKTESENYFKSHQVKDPDEGKIKWIINCSAYTAVDKAEEDEEKARALNYQGVLNIARTARSHGAKLIHISTDYVFDGKGKEPYKEDCERNPTGVYGKTKAEGEDAVTSSMTQYYILRTAWLYGFYGRNFVYTMTKLFNSKDEIKVVGDQWGTPTNALDLANVIVKIIDKSNNAHGLFGSKSALNYGIYHFTDEGITNWHEFASTINKEASSLGIVNHQCTVNSCTTEEYGAKAPRPLYSVLSKEKIAKALKIKIPDWKTSLKSFLKDKRFDPELINIQPK